MKRAFLSHSSRDEEFVMQVAAELGREGAIFYESCFDIGAGIEEAILQGLDQSSVFVFFASKNSVRLPVSKWLKLESAQAEERVARQIINRPLTFVIDDDVTIDEIPPWLRATNVGLANCRSPRIIARKIRQHLDALIREEQFVPVVGRGQDSDRAKRALAPFGKTSARVFSFFGLQGVGRRTLCRDLVRSMYSLFDLYEIRIEEGDELEDIALKLNDAVTPLNSTELAALAKRIRAETSDEQVARCVAALQSMVRARFLPTFVDDDGILDNDGRVSPSISAVVSAVARDKEAFLSFILTRRFVIDASEPKTDLPSIRVDPLSTEDTELLVSLLVERDQIALDSSDVRAVAKWVRGHPPSAVHAVELMATHGVDDVRDGTKLIVYRDAYFLRALERDGNIGSNRRLLLRAIVEYGQLPASALQNLIAGPGSDYNEEMRYLIDKAFVVPQLNRLYKVADPLTDAILRTFKGITIDHREIAAGLQIFLDRIIDADDSEDELIGHLGRLELERALWRAHVLSGEKEAASGIIHLPADLIRSLKTAYHSQHYEEAVEFGSAAVEVRPSSIEARSLYARALIRMKRWADAREQIRIFHDQGNLRDEAYLFGLFHQARNDHANAAKQFRESIRFGRSGPAVNRELAESLFYLNEYSDAEHYAREAVHRDDANRFAIDLLIRILIRRQKFDDARILLRQLKLYDDSAFYLHRKSVLELEEGNVDEAMVDAEAACNERRNSAAMLVQLAKCQIAANKFATAQASLDLLERRKADLSSEDVFTGLRVKLASALGSYEEALLIWEGIKNKEWPVHIVLRIEALNGYIALLKQIDPLRQALIEQRDSLSAKIDFAAAERIQTSAAEF